MAKFRDYYEILEVKRGAALDDIKSSYRRLARKYHPDLNRHDPAAEAKFREVQEAYDVLSDAAKRRQYDALGANYRAGMDFQMPNGWARREAPSSGGGGGFSDFFEMLFGAPPRPRESARFGGSAGSASAQQKGTGDVETTLQVSLEDIHQGASKRVQLNIRATCAACQGSGFIGGNACGACDGKGVAPRPRAIEIKIPQTAKEGTRLRLAGQGETVSGKPGDLYVKIKIIPHPIFVPDSNNINVELPVAPWEAVLGGEVDVPTLDGMVKMKLPPGTQNGVKMRLQQRGLRTETGRGDEIVRVKIVIPAEITERERHLFRQLRDISHFRPRVKDRSAQ